mgnify:CR=1 FL=1
MKPFDTNVDEWKQNKQKPLIIFGRSGSGKSTLAQKLLDGYNLIRVSPENIENINIEEYILSSIGRKDIMQMFSTSIGKALYIDDFQLFKTAVQSKLVSIIRDCKIPSVIVTTKINRSIDSLKKFSFFVEIAPSINDIIQIVCATMDPGMNKTQLANFIRDCHLNLNIIFLHLSVQKNNTDHKERTENITKELMNTQSYSDYYSLSEYNTVGFNLLHDLSRYMDHDRIVDVYDSIILGGLVESFPQNDSLYYDLLILHNVIFPHKIISEYRNNKTYSYKYNNYLSRSMICVHQNNIHQELSSTLHKNFDDTLLHILLNPEAQVDLSTHSLMKSFIFKRLKYLSSVIDIKMNKKRIEKQTHL